MNRKHILIFLLASLAMLLILMPYTKDIEQFKATDLTWAMLKKAKTTKVFDFSNFGFEPKTEYHSEIDSLNGKPIVITGFFKNETHDSQSLLLLTENVTNVCAMCNHDEHYAAIVLHPADSALFNLPDDALLAISGIFEYDTTKHLYYHINQAVIDSILILKNRK